MRRGREGSNGGWDKKKEGPSSSYFFFSTTRAAVMRARASSVPRPRSMSCTAVRRYTYYTTHEQSPEEGQGTGGERVS